MSFIRTISLSKCDSGSTVLLLLYLSSIVFKKTAIRQVGTTETTPHLTHAQLRFHHKYNETHKLELNVYKLRRCNPEHRRCLLHKQLRCFIAVFTELRIYLNTDVHAPKYNTEVIVLLILTKNINTCQAIK